MSDIDDKIVLKHNESLASSNLSDHDEINEKSEKSEKSIKEFLFLDKPFYRYGFINLLNFYIFLITISSTCNGYDGSMLNGLQIVETWEKNILRNNLGALSNGTTFGGFFAMLFASYISDKFGRKIALAVGAILIIIGAVLQGASYNYGFFLAARFVIGMGSGIAVASSPSLISEIAYPTHRDICTALYNSCWYLGALIAAWVTYGTHFMTTDYAWKIPSYLQGILPLFQLALLYWVPESPRFLIRKGKIDKAKAILRKWHTGNDYSDRATALVEFEAGEIQAALALEDSQAHSSYMDFLRLPSYRKRLFLVVFTAFFMQLSGNGLVSYYLNKVLDTIGITDANSQLKINGYLMLYNLVISWFTNSMVHFFKRRTLFLASLSGMLVCYIIWTILSARFAIGGYQDQSLAKGVLAFIFLFYFCYNAGCNGAPFLYVTEILPYSHRAKGLNLFSGLNNLFIIYNGFVNPVAMDAIEWKYYIVYCCILACEVVIVYFFYVETATYSTLEEISAAFGDDPDHIVANSPEKVVFEHKETV
ncbi:unnamed protein product [Candida verbasci]|uniref:Major facilitator superfamily (MFS) profile domain-containing protein n=1 Tax=Candida verbasci TaxID=1227364 RepID=A0A9W4TXC4_9ASCO|nr:unnamed protein product [Candida verbasci]